MAFRNARALLALVFLASAAVGTLPQRAQAIGVGETAPNFTLMDLDGYPHSLNAYSSHPVLLFFMGCSEDIAISLAPLLETDFHRQFSSRGLYVLGIDALGCGQAELDHFRNTTGISFPLLTEGGMVQQAYGESIGTVVLVDGGGIVRYVGRQYDEPALRHAVEETLREANSTLEKTWGDIKDLYGEGRRSRR
jgi:peroxiredoxin